MPNCPICDLPEQNVQQISGEYFVDCKKCGSYRVASEIVDDLGPMVATKPFLKPALSSHIRNYSQPEKRLTWATVERIASEYIRPNPAEQANQVLLHLDAKVGKADPALRLTIDPEELQGFIGAHNINGVNYIVKHLQQAGYISGQWENFRQSDRTILSEGVFQGHVTFKGWSAIRELKASVSTSTTVFMAMKFGDSALDDVIQKFVVPAVRETGFRLIRLDDEPRAGLIDDRMRLAIRSARFLIAELTHANNGAYWEAGYAEGLGKPVIYLCRKDVFDDPHLRPHFDTNHHLTVLWEETSIDEAMARLKATIRFTLPEAYNSHGGGN